LIHKINVVRYHYVFDLHNNLRSKLICCRLKKNFVNHIIKNKIRQQKLVRLKIKSYKNIKSIPERYLEVGKPAGVNDDNLGLEYYWNRSSEQKINGILDKIPDRRKKILIGLAPGAGFYTKRWPVEYFVDLIDKIESKYKSWFIILGDISDIDLGKSISKNRKNILDLTGQLSIMETGALLSNLNLAVTNDSGLMHMSTAVHTPVIAIFGSSVKEFGFFPFRGESLVMENLNAECRPCSHIGRRSCPQGHFKCMREITPDQVFSAAEEYLRELQKD
jgi:lipopolysaccharide heptosyltransferase II